MHTGAVYHHVATLAMSYNTLLSLLLLLLLIHLGTVHTVYVHVYVDVCMCIHIMVHNFCLFDTA